MEAVKFSLLLLLLAAALFGAPAAAQENYYNPSLPEGAAPPAEGESAVTGSFVVTSLQKCYEQLNPEDALEIQRNYAKPYEECQRRLALKLKAARTAKPGEEKPEEKAAEKSGGFFSVSRRGKSAKPGPGAAAEKPAAPRAQEKVPLQ